MEQSDLKSILADLQRIRTDVEKDMNDTTRAQETTRDLAERIEAIRKRREDYIPPENQE